MDIQEALQKCIDNSGITGLAESLGPGFRIGQITAVIIPIEHWENLVKAIDDDDV